MDKRITFPVIEGVTQAFMGIVRCKDFVSILTDSDGKMLTNIFEDNVRDFQGYNSVNSEIKETINHPDDQNRFALLNNGITIIAKTIKVTGDSIDIFDYQIVNGCQTSYVLYENRPYKYHLACAIKALEVGSQVVFGQKRKQRKEFEKLYALIKDDDKINRHLRSAISCIDAAFIACPEIPKSDRHRSKVQFTRDYTG